MESTYQHIRVINHQKPSEMIVSKMIRCTREFAENIALQRISEHDSNRKG